MPTNFDMDALRTLLAGIDLGNFARAANEVGRSQSAVSMQMKKLEQQAGVPLFVRKGRGLVPTEAGETFVQHARQIIAMNDDAARSIGAPVAPETLRLGLPQDFFDDVMPITVRTLSKAQPQSHLMVRAGNNHTIYGDIEAGRLDGAIAFFPMNSGAKGTLLCKLPVRWIASRDLELAKHTTQLPLVLFNHPCIFRQAAIASLDRSNTLWRAALTTPSLAAVWAALRSGFGIGVRIEHALPDDIVDVGKKFKLPKLPSVELRLLQAEPASELSDEMMATLKRVTMDVLKQ